MLGSYYNSPELQRGIAQYSATAPLKTQVPRYAEGGATTTQGTVPDYNADFLKTLRDAGMSEVDIANLTNFTGIDDSLYGLNFASDFGGGAMGGIYKDDPNTEYISAPISNKGNFTSPSGNVFIMRADQKVRLVDLNTNKVVFEGTGYDAAREATRLGQNLTDTLGREASYDIQTADPSGKYTTVANEKYNKSTMEVLESTVLDIALPIIMNAVIPGSGFLSTMAGNALGAVASGVIQGKGIGDIATSALIAGAVGGFTQQTGLDKAIGGALNDLGSNLAKEAVEEAGEEIVVTAIGELARSAGGAVANTIINAGINEITEQAAEKATGDIVALGNPVSDAVAGTVSGIGGSAANAVINQPATTEPPKTAEQAIEEQTGDIVALAETAPSATVPVTGIGNPAVNTVTNQPATAEQIIEQETGDIVALADTTPSATVPVTGIGGAATNAVTNPPATAEQIIEQETGDIVALADPAPSVTVPVTGIGGGATDTLGPPTNLLPDNFFDPPPEDDSILDTIGDVADVVTAVLPLVPVVTGGGGGGGGTPPPDNTGLTFTEGTLTPTIPTSGIGGTGGPYPYTPQTYGRAGGDQETEYLFFTRDPITGQGTVQSGTPVTTTATAPVTTTTTNQTSGPSGYVPPSNLFAEGGEVNDDIVKHLVEYHKNGGHRGPGQVKGIGSGQEDKIPAYLSDGEYVWSAQDVSDLGDGSNDEGVRRLNKMRQMVRQQAGRKDIKKIAKPQKGIDRMLKAVGGLA